MLVFDSYVQIETWRRWKCDPKLSWYESMMGQDQLCQKFRKCHHLGPRYDFFTKKISDLLLTRQSNICLCVIYYVIVLCLWWTWAPYLFSVAKTITASLIWKPSSMIPNNRADGKFSLSWWWWSIYNVEVSVCLSVTCFLILLGKLEIICFKKKFFQFLFPIFF